MSLQEFQDVLDSSLSTIVDIEFPEGQIDYKNQDFVQYRFKLKTKSVKEKKEIKHKMFIPKAREIKGLQEKEVLSKLFEYVGTSIRNQVTDNLNIHSKNTTSRFINNYKEIMRKYRSVDEEEYTAMESSFLDPLGVFSKM